MLRQEKIILALTRFGVSRVDVEIYLFLSKKGRQTAKDVAEGLNLPESTVYYSLRRLRDKGLIIIMHERIKRFKACSLESIMKTQVQNRLDQARNLRKDSTWISSMWSKIIGENSGKSD